VVGTSAGSVVGAQILGGLTLEELYARQLEDVTGEIAAKMSVGAMARFVMYAMWPGEQRGRARLGRAASRAHTVPESERRAVIGGRLPSPAWPERKLKITAVDAETGELRTFDRDSGVTLLDAVAASCAVPLVWPPITIGGRRYIDGGARSVANADLAIGCDRVIVLAPVTLALRRSSRLVSQLASLGAGVRSVVVSPDAQARRAIGGNSLDPARRAASARAGQAQAASAIDSVKAVWVAA